MSAARSFAVTVREALDSAVTAIAAAGADTPRLDAELLLAHALGVERAALVMDPDRPVDGAPARWFRDAVRRRSARREPVAYLTGRRGFRRLELGVDRRVLVPRPETELLVEVGLELPSGTRVLDVGTGSGAIALALKDERPDADVAGTDASAGALEVARTNAARLGLEVAFVEADLLEPASSAGDAPPALTAPDAVLSNPPYVAETDRPSLPPEVAAHEPPGALFAGADGLDVLRRLLPAAAASTARLIAVEVGAGQAGAVAGLARDAGFARVEARRDLAGIERVVVARR